MNVYDFDKTIFYPDSVEKFDLFCIRRHPTLFFKYFFPLLGTYVKFRFKKASRNQLHAKYNCIVKYLKHPEQDVIKFWNKYEKNISTWYIKQKRSDDLIISGAPEFILKPICDRLGVKYIGSIVDLNTGVMVGNVRVAKEKAKYIIEMNMPMIENFYSDSLLDTPLALLAENAFLVKDKGTKPTPWPSINEIANKVIKKINQ